MKQRITGWHQDELGDWVAELACGHGQHVRHTPPLSERPWVLERKGRERFIGFLLNCVLCDEESESQEKAKESGQWTNLPPNA